MTAQPFSARDATPDDYERYAELFVELGVPDAPPSREEFVAQLRRQIFVVCDADGRVVGYGMGRVSGPRWYVSNVVTAREARRRGVGRAIMEEHARRARAQGLSSWALNVKRDNVAAIALYASVGMTIAARAWAMGIPWNDVANLTPSEAHAVVAVTPDRDEDIEVAFGFAPGFVASERERPARVLVAIEAQGEPAGFASFDPSFPGASPFRVREARWGRALLDAVRPHARPNDAHVRVTVEGDEALAQALALAGGGTYFDLYAMRGALG